VKITLCGSTRFKDTYNKINVDLTLAGHVVYSVASFNESGKSDGEKDDVYDLVHLLKIQNSDAIFVVDRDAEFDTPYIGKSTAKEIKWAKMTGKPVYAWADLAKLKSKI
jgi:hypothetical protein